MDVKLPVEVLDVEYLEEIKEMNQAGSDILPQMIEEFGRQMQDGLTRIPQYIGEHATDQLISLSHKLKGSCSNLGALRLASLFSQLEIYTKDHQVDENSSQFFNLIKDEYSVAFKRLEEDWK